MTSWDGGHGHYALHYITAAAKKNSGRCVYIFMTTYRKGNAKTI